MERSCKDCQSAVEEQACQTIFLYCPLTHTVHRCRASPMWLTRLKTESQSKCIQFKTQNVEEALCSLFLVSHPWRIRFTHSFRKILTVPQWLSQTPETWVREERESVGVYFRGACGKCLLCWNNPCLSVAAGCPLLGPGGVVFPGQHSLGHLRLGLLIREWRRPLRPAGKHQHSRELLKSPTTHQQPSSFPLQVYRSKQKFTGYFKWNPTLVAKQKPLSIPVRVPPRSGINLRIMDFPPTSNFTESYFLVLSTVSYFSLS